MVVHPECLKADIESASNEMLRPFDRVGVVVGTDIDGEEVGPLDEEPFAVHRADGAVPGDVAKPDPVERRIARLSVDSNLYVDVDEWLVAEGSGPPEPGLGKVEPPTDAVDPLGESASGPVNLLAVDGGDHLGLATSVAVEGEPKEQVGAGVVGIAAQHAEPVDANRAGVDDTHGSGQPDGEWPVLTMAGD